MLLLLRNLIHTHAYLYTQHHLQTQKYNSRRLKLGNEYFTENNKDAHEHELEIDAMSPHQQYKLDMKGHFRMFDVQLAP